MGTGVQGNSRVSRGGFDKCEIFGKSETDVLRQGTEDSDATARREETPMDAVRPANVASGIKWPWHRAFTGEGDPPGGPAPGLALRHGINPFNSFSSKKDISHDSRRKWFRICSSAQKSSCSSGS